MLNLGPFLPWVLLRSPKPKFVNFLPPKGNRISSECGHATRACYISGHSFHLSSPECTETPITLIESFLEVVRTQQHATFQTSPSHVRLRMLRNLTGRTYGWTLTISMSPSDFIGRPILRLWQSPELVLSNMLGPIFLPNFDALNLKNAHRNAKISWFIKLPIIRISNKTQYLHNQTCLRSWNKRSLCHIWNLIWEKMRI